MKKLMTLAALAAISLMRAAGQAAASPSSAERTLAEVSVTYSALRANVPVGECGCFWMSGGSVELAVPVWRSFSGVVELSGEHVAGLPGYADTGLSLLSGMGGLRVSHATRMRLTPFAQGLVGGVHAFDSYFPSTTRPTSYATSFAMAAGGGVDLALTAHVLIRPVQAEYQYMQLPNSSTNQQHDVRLSAGVVFRFLR